jgi:hypothetical protein
MALDLVFHQGPGKAFELFAALKAWNKIGDAILKDENGPTQDGRLGNTRHDEIDEGIIEGFAGRIRRVLKVGAFWPVGLRRRAGLLRAVGGLANAVQPSPVDRLTAPAPGLVRFAA